MTKEINIGICVTETNYQNYPAWIQSAGDQYAIIELSFEKQNKHDLQKCQALLLTGGVDIDPIFYNPTIKEYPLQPTHFNKERDSFEMELLKDALAIGLPVLGICRGLQLINVALGGTLILDIETIGKPNHRKMEGIDKVHELLIEANSQLAGITHCSKGIINSAHHQSVLATADQLKVSGYSRDGIIESMEWKDQSLHKSPLICVQWHPERMEEKNTNPLSKNILEWFLYEAEKTNL
jgi:putative glutamine amidotransferase